MIRIHFQRISLFLGILICCPSPGFADQNLQARFEKSLKDAKSLTDVEVEYLDTYWRAGDGDRAAFSRTFLYYYLASGVKQRAAVKLVSATVTNLAKGSESAYDGESYFTYDEDAKYMTRRDKPTPGDASHGKNPMVAPFMFLTTYSDACPFCVLRFTDLSMTNGFMLPKAQLANGSFEISMPGLTLAKQPTEWKIDIEEYGDSFTPKTITTVIPGGRVQVVNRLLNYTNLGAYQFPTTIEWTMTSYPPTTPPKLVSTGTITVVSARIPNNMENSTFRLDDHERSAAVIWDSDHAKLLRSAPWLVKVEAKHAVARAVVILMVLFTIAVPSVVAIRNRAKKRAA